VLQNFNLNTVSAWFHDKELTKMNMPETPEKKEGSFTL
jgi:hypothetical protein